MQLLYHSPFPLSQRWHLPAPTITHKPAAIPLSTLHYLPIVVAEISRVLLSHSWPHAKLTV
jgi:hypothetical protein